MPERTRNTVPAAALSASRAAPASPGIASVSVVGDRFDRATAVVGGLAAALGTDLLLLSGLSYFQYGQYALPAAGWVAELLATT